VLLGVEGYAETGMEGAERGLSPDAIQGRALVAGFGDLAMGEVFGEAGEVKLWKSLLDAAGTSTFSSIANTFADYAWAGDKSYIMEEYQACLDANMSKEEAVKQVAWTELGKLGENVVQGVATAGAFHGAGRVISNLGVYMGLADGPSHLDADVDGLREIDTNDRIPNEDDTVTSYADLMSPEDAEKYLKFLEKGSEAGLTSEEIAGIRKLDELIALEKVDYQDALNMRNADDILRDGTDSVYIPRDADGNPISLRKQTINGQDIPLPDPAAEGRPHTVLGGKISSETGEVYRQSATFPDGTWPTANGHDVPWSEVHWTDHGTPHH